MNEENALTSNDIKRIAIFAEFANGEVRQILAEERIKRACLHLLTDDNNTIKVMQELTPFTFE